MVRVGGGGGVIEVCEMIDEHASNFSIKTKPASTWSERLQDSSDTTS